MAVNKSSGILKARTGLKKHTVSALLPKTNQIPETFDSITEIQSWIIQYKAFEEKKKICLVYEMSMQGDTSVLAVRT